MITESTIFDAIRQGDAEQVRELLADNPELAESRNAQGASTVLWAVYTRHAELAPLLLSGRQADFFEACALGDTARAGELLVADHELAAQYSADGFTGLGFACFFGHRELAQLLLESGADASQAARNGLGVAPLHSASSSGQAAVVAMLLRHGAAPNALEGSGMTPLHTAAGTGNREIVAQLLAAGADRTLRSADGRTPADVARQYGHAGIGAELDSGS